MAGEGDELLPVGEVGGKPVESSALNKTNDQIHGNFGLYGNFETMLAYPIPACTEALPSHYNIHTKK